MGLEKSIGRDEQVCPILGIERLYVICSYYCYLALVQPMVTLLVIRVLVMIVIG